MHLSRFTYQQAVEAVVEKLTKTGRVTLLPYEPVAREIVEALGWRRPCLECDGRGLKQVSVSWSTADGMGGGTITQETCGACGGSGAAR